MKRTTRVVILVLVTIFIILPVTYATILLAIELVLGAFGHRSHPIWGVTDPEGHRVMVGTLERWLVAAAGFFVCALGLVAFFVTAQRLGRPISGADGRKSRPLWRWNRK